MTLGGGIISLLLLVRDSMVPETLRLKGDGGPNISCEGVGGGGILVEADI